MCKGVKGLREDYEGTERAVVCVYLCVCVCTGAGAAREQHAV